MIDRTDTQLKVGSYYEVTFEQPTGERERHVLRWGSSGRWIDVNGYDAGTGGNVIRRVDKPDPKTCPHPSIGRFGACRYCGDPDARRVLDAYNDYARRLT